MKSIVNYNIFFALTFICGYASDYMNWQRLRQTGVFFELMCILVIVFQTVYNTPWFRFRVRWALNTCNVKVPSHWPTCCPSYRKVRLHIRFRLLPFYFQILLYYTILRLCTLIDRWGTSSAQWLVYRCLPSYREKIAWRLNLLNLGFVSKNSIYLFIYLLLCIT